MCVFSSPKPGLFGSAEAQGVPAEAAGAGGQGRRPRCGRSGLFKDFRILIHVNKKVDLVPFKMAGIRIPQPWTKQ